MKYFCSGAARLREGRERALAVRHVCGERLLAKFTISLVNFSGDIGEDCVKSRETEQGYWSREVCEVNSL